eukprot:442993-Hanusia_phi.AAC.1
MFFTDGSFSGLSASSDPRPGRHMLLPVPALLVVVDYVPQTSRFQPLELERVSRLPDLSRARRRREDEKRAGGRERSVERRKREAKQGE